MSSDLSNHLLAIRDLAVDYRSPPDTITPALRGVSLDLRQGQSLGVIGESGAGKSTLALSILRILPSHGQILRGSIRFDGQEILGLSESRLRQIRGHHFSMIFQHPLMALHPMMRIGPQIADVIRAHRAWTWRRCRLEAKSILSRIAPDAIDRILGSYPHQLSGGERQCVCIAQALACGPKLVIADEPTAALDSVTQVDLLRLLRDLKQSTSTSFLFITHNPALLAGLADEAITLRHGAAVERSGLAKLHACRGPLSDSLPNLAAGLSPVDSEDQALVIVRRVRKEFVWKAFASRRKRIRALDDIDLAIRRGSSTGIVGASGSGKSTLARCIAGLEKPDDGEILYRGRRVADFGAGELRSHRLRVQLVFQEPAATLNPRFTAAQAIAEPLLVAGIGAPGDRRRAAVQWMERLGLPTQAADRPVLEFSGGQRQRIALARVLAPGPELIVLDESLSGLDPPLQGRILNLLAELRSTGNLTCILISHDIGLVGGACDALAVMHAGRIVESGGTRQLFTAPEHPHTQALLAAAGAPAGSQGGTSCGT